MNVGLEQDLHKCFDLQKIEIQVQKEQWNTYTVLKK